MTTHTQSLAVDLQFTPTQLAAEAVRLWRDLQETEHEAAMLRTAIRDRVALLPEQKVTEPGLVTIAMTAEVPAGSGYSYTKHAIDEVCTRLEEIQTTGAYVTVDEVLAWLVVARTPSPGRARSLRITPMRIAEGDAAIT